MGFVFSIAILWGGALLIMGIDKRIRREKGGFGFDEPEWGTLIALTLLCNVLALPYYFYFSRNKSVGWGLAGVGMFLGCFLLAFIASMVASFAAALVSA